MQRHLRFKSDRRPQTVHPDGLPYATAAARSLPLATVSLIAVQNNMGLALNHKVNLAVPADCDFRRMAWSQNKQRRVSECPSASKDGRRRLGPFSPVQGQSAGDEEDRNMFSPSIGVSELMLRAIVVYAFVLLLLRIVGKKHIGEMAPFDLVVLLILSESVQNALVADDKSLVGGLIVAATLFAANQLLGYATWRSKTLARLFEGTPRVLVRNGRVCSDVLAREQVTHSELLEALRREGCSSLVNVRYAVLENDGNITIGLRARARYHLQC